MSPDALQTRLQGAITHDRVLKKLEFGKGVETHHKQWIQKWIGQLTTEQLKRFLRLITGTPAIGENRICIEFYGERCEFVTCAYLLRLPEASSASNISLVDMLNYALDTPIAFTMR